MKAEIQLASRQRKCKQRIRVAKPFSTHSYWPLRNVTNELSIRLPFITVPQSLASSCQVSSFSITLQAPPYYPRDPLVWSSHLILQCPHYIHQAIYLLLIFVHLAVNSILLVCREVTQTQHREQFF